MLCILLLFYFCLPVVFSNVLFFRFCASDGTDTCNSLLIRTSGKSFHQKTCSRIEVRHCTVVLIMYVIVLLLLLIIRMRGGEFPSRKWEV